MTVLTSWNGATNVASWQILGGSSLSALVPLQTEPKSGFQMTAIVTTSDRYIETRALDANGNVLGTSASSSPS